VSVTLVCDGDGPALVRVEHPDLPFGYAEGYVTADGLFVTRRIGTGWLWDVWASVEAFCTHRNNPAALVAGNLGLSAALAAADHEGDTDE
jgi:hypothetical protein